MENIKIKREEKLINEGSPCMIDYFNKKILTVKQVKQGQGYRKCSNFSPCESGENHCTLTTGIEVAQHIIQEGTSLEKELLDFSKTEFISERFWNSVDGKEFELIEGQGRVLRAIEGFARVALLMNPFESVFNTCEKCAGSRIPTTIYDSIHYKNMGPGGRRGGETKAREVEYCPECDPMPQGGIIMNEIGVY